MHSNAGSQERRTCHQEQPWLSSLPLGCPPFSDGFQVSILDEYSTLEGLKEWIDEEDIPKGTSSRGSMLMKGTSSLAFFLESAALGRPLPSAHFLLVLLFLFRGTLWPTDYGGTGLLSVGECETEKQLWEYVRKITVDGFHELEEEEESLGEGDNAESSWWFD